MTDSETEFIAEIAYEVVMQVRKLHFREGPSPTMRTKKLKEIIENNSKNLSSHAS